MEFLQKIDENHAAEVDDEYELVETVIDSMETSDLETNIASWIHEIDEEAKKLISSSDDSNRDNILENKEFAKLFLQLCKMLPLFSAISNKFFDSPNLIGSSWSSETYFKNVRQLHGNGIPYSPDVFIKRDIQLTNSTVVKASQTFLSIQFEHFDFSDDDATIAINVNANKESDDGTQQNSTVHTKKKVDKLTSSTQNDSW